MNLAAITAVFAGISVLTTVAGCALNTSPGTELNHSQRVLIQKDYAGYQEIQELSEFSASLRDLTREQIASEEKAAARRLETSPSVVNRLRYALTLFYGAEDTDDLRRALSLIDDRNIGDGSEAAAFWNFFAEHYGAMLKAQIDLRETNERLLTDREVILADKESLDKSLQAARADLAKLQKQLDELTSIEKSILERDIAEDVAKP